MYIYNTMARKKEELIPKVPGRVGIYACGPTVYNYIHIGNARPVVVFDTLRRYLLWRGYEVDFIQNYTDIDDKMIAKANSEGATIGAIAERYIKAYEEDTKGLNVLEEKTFHPKATEHIAEIISIIESLIEKGLAYQTQDGVYFNTKAFPGYGKLSGQNLDDLESGARVQVDETKQNPMDFALWKARKPGEPFWPSPFGEGRPGWHIECSAMSMKYLGETIDIHCGGQDLVFPHHENEVAQSEGATGKPFAKYWMHNGFINVNNEKLSKSKGNFFGLREVGEEYDLEAVRYFLLSAHYRSPLNFSKEQMDQAAAALERLYTAKENYEFLLEKGGAADRALNEKEQAFVDSLPHLKQRFIGLMDDDLNTAGALSVLFDLVYEGNLIAQSGVAAAAVRAALELLEELSGVLGLLFKGAADASGGVQVLVEQREAARKARDWKEADRLRDLIKEMGYALEDTPQGAKIKKL